MGTRQFFTVGMGLRLRALRLRAGLTQDEAAARMGLAGAHRRRLVERLELARVQDPALSAIARYLKACGARWARFTDLLEEAEPVATDLGALNRAGLDPETTQELKEKVRQQVQRSQDGLPYWRRNKPIHPNRCRQAGVAFGKYRIVAGLIEHAVEQELKATGLSLVNYPVYLAVSRHCLGLLWRMARSSRMVGSRQQAAGSMSRAGAGRPAERPAGKLAAKETYWRRQKLDMALVKRMQQVVVERFEQLVEESPELFGASPRC